MRSMQLDASTIENPKTLQKVEEQPTAGKKRVQKAKDKEEIKETNPPTPDVK